MILKHFTAGELETNNYLVICEETREAALIDAGGNYEKTAKFLKENNANLKYILHTHGHFDHVQGDWELQKNFDVKILIHKDDEPLVKSLKQQLMIFGMKSAEAPKIDGFLEDGQIIEVGNLKLKVIHTPGHTQGGVCFLIDKVLFAGDTLFAESVGRTDLPGGSYEALGNSIKNKLFTLDENIIVYPGHGPSTTIGHEKQNNPYFGAEAKPQT
ncbi:MAG TPA: MBL fold metallo-hydrolase [Cyanobacteria bacterium UBA9971]|nr:MBL fold metallo-hydrolase [Cyanobacteria bacterium UBA9971]